MGTVNIQVSGKSKKDCARQIGMKLNEAAKCGLRKEGKTLYGIVDGQMMAIVVVRS